MLADPLQEKRMSKGVPEPGQIRVLPTAYITLMGVADSRLYSLCSCSVCLLVRYHRGKDFVKTASATAAGAGRMQKHPWAARRMDGRHPGEPSGMTAFPGTCSQIRGDNSPRAAMTNWDLHHSSQGMSRAMSKKEGTLNADVKADVQGDKEERCQEQGLLQSSRSCRTESEGV